MCALFWYLIFVTTIYYTHIICNKNKIPLFFWVSTIFIRFIFVIGTVFKDRLGTYIFHFKYFNFNLCLLTFALSNNNTAVRKKKKKNEIESVNMHRLRCYNVFWCYKNWKIILLKPFLFHVYLHISVFNIYV